MKACKVLDKHRHKQPADPIRALTAAIILQAVDTYWRGADVRERLDAICWLAGDDFPMFAEVAGISAENGLHFLEVANDRRTNRT